MPHPTTNTNESMDLLALSTRYDVTVAFLRPNSVLDLPRDFFTGSGVSSLGGGSGMYLGL